MGLLFCEKAQARDASANLVKNEKTWKREIQFSKTYVVLACDTTEDTLSISNTIGLPRVRTTTQQFNEYIRGLDNSAFTNWIQNTSSTNREYYLATQTLPEGFVCKNVQVKEAENIWADAGQEGQSGHKWTAAYEVQVSFDNQVDQEDPEEFEAEVSWESESEQLQLVKDRITEDPVVTANNEPISVEFRNILPVLKLKVWYNYNSFSPQAAKYNYENTVCSSAFWGFPPRSALLDGLSIVRISRENAQGDKIYYWEVSYSIKFRLDGSDNPWKAKVLHQGTLYRTVRGGKIKKYTGDGGTGLVNLDANGVMLPDTATELNYREFNVYKTADWSSLGIGENDVRSMG